jgi:hypothetical protein
MRLASPKRSLAALLRRAFCFATDVHLSVDNQLIGMPAVKQNIPVT